MSILSQIPLVLTYQGRLKGQHDRSLDIKIYVDINDLI